MIEVSIRTLLRQGDLLGVGEKIYTWKAAEGVAAPYVVIVRVGEDIEVNSKKDSAIRMHTIQIVLYTPDPLYAAASLEKIRARLQHFVGTVGDHWIQACTKSIELVSEQEPATKLYGAISQYDVAYWPAA